MPVINRSTINWNLAKLDWDMVLRHRAEMAKVSASMNNAAMAAGASMQNAQTGAEASMANAQTGAQASMQNAALQAQVATRGQDIAEHGQALDYAAKMAGLGVQARGQDLAQQQAMMEMQTKQRGQDVAMAQSGLGNLPPIQKELLNHQMDAQAAQSVLFGKNPQQAWDKYYEALKISGKNPEALGLSPVANAHTMMYMGDVLDRSTKAISSITAGGENSKQSSQPTKTEQAQQAQANKLEAMSVNQNLKYINNLKEEAGKYASSLPDMESARSALRQYNSFGPGLGPGFSTVTEALSTAAAKLGSEKGKEAQSAGAVIDSLGNSLALLKRSDMPGALSDSDRNFLVSMSISRDKTLQENEAALSALQAGMERKVLQSTFMEAWAANHGGKLDGAMDAFRQFNQDYPMVDPKTHEIRSVPADAWQKYAGVNVQQQMPDQQQQQMVMEQPQAQPQQMPPQPPMQNIYGPSNAGQNIYK